MVQDDVVGQTKDNKNPRWQTKHRGGGRAGAWGSEGRHLLDDEACLLAEEIDDERSDGMLTAELGVHDLPAT